MVSVDEKLDEVWQVRHDGLCRRIDDHETRLNSLERERAVSDVNHALLSRDMAYLKSAVDDMKTMLDRMAAAPGESVSVFKRALISGFATAASGGVIAAIVWLILNMN